MKNKPTVNKPLAVPEKPRDFWHTLGPGLVTGAADDDPSGITTYSQAGAQYGNQLLWLASFTFPLMAVVQGMCARIGMVTGRGLAANIRQHYPAWVLRTCTVLLFAVNSFNIGVDLGAMAQAVRLLMPAAPFAFLVAGFAVICLLLEIFTTYKTYARYLKWLAFALLAYVFSSLLVGLDWRDVLYSTVVPTLQFSRRQVLLVCAVLGTTISPYLFFWQTSQEVEEEILAGKTTVSKRRDATAVEIRAMRTDNWIGMFFSNLVMFFIIAASAATLHRSGITDIQSAAQAAEALRPLAGAGAYLLFTLGIIGAGLLAVPVLAGSASYAISESFGWREGLYRKLRSAHAFYGVIIVSTLLGLLLNFIGLDPIKALIYAAILNGLVSPLILFLIVRLSSSRRIMGQWVNGRLVTMLGWLITAVMVVVGAVTLVLLVF